MRIKLLNLSLCVLTTATAVTTIATPLLPCNYDNPVVAQCQQDSDYPTFHSVSCRSIGSNGSGNFGTTADCTYYWCDTSTVCKTNSHLYQQKLRGKRYQSVLNVTSATPCNSRYTVTDTTDTEIGCCLCQMPDVPTP